MYSNARIATGQVRYQTCTCTPRPCTCTPVLLYFWTLRVWLSGAFRLFSFCAAGTGPIRRQSGNAANLTQTRSSPPMSGPWAAHASSGRLLFQHFAAGRQFRIFLWELHPPPTSSSRINNNSAARRAGAVASRRERDFYFGGDWLCASERAVGRTDAGWTGVVG
jgi:hypothetical protein